MLFKFGREVQRIPVSDPFNQCLDWQFRLPAQQFRGGPHPAFDQQSVRRRMEVTAKQAGQVGRRTPVELRHLLYGMGRITSASMTLPFLPPFGCRESGMPPYASPGLTP